MSTDENSDAMWWTDRLHRAVTFYPWATMRPEEEICRLAERGVNTLFVVTKESDGRVFYDSDFAPNQVPGGRDLLGELVNAADIHDVRIVPLLFVLCDKYLLETYPDAVQVARDGTEITYPNVSAEHMHWACPNQKPVRNHLRNVVDEVATYDVDGVQLTHFGFQPILNGDESYRSCFCEECLATHEGEDIEESSTWIDSRCQTVTDLLHELVSPFREADDLLVDIELETFADLQMAATDSRKTLGVDPHELARLADVFTPRTPHVDMDVHPFWIREVVRSLRAETETPVLPSIRTAEGRNPENRLISGELLMAIQLALQGGAEGVTLFSDGANIGRLTPEQWDTVEEVFDEMETFEREYGIQNR